MPRLCLCCKRPIAFASTVMCDVCNAAIQQASKTYNLSYIDQCYAAFYYCDVSRLAIFRLKYYGKRRLARPIARLMHDEARARGLSGDIIVPVPIHKSRMRQRGFNQARLLALELANLMALPCADILKRTKHTEKQAGMSLAQRLSNIEGAFDIEPCNIQDKHIILVDDILTTGTTAAQCAKLLLEQGASEVSLIVFLTADDNKR